MAGLVLRVPTKMILPDNASFVNRFQIKSSSSDRLYTIAQSKSGRWWSCGCPGWISHRKCKHLTSMNLPCGQVPFEATLVSTER